MKLLTELLTDTIKQAFADCGYPENLGQVVVSNRLDLCQFQCNGALSAAKIYKKSPVQIAREVVSKVKENGMMDCLEVVSPGFINITIKDEFLIGYVTQVFADPYKGVPQSDIGETIVLDYGNPNVAKPLHVGHLRSAIIGESLKRIVQATGRTAIGDVHLGDWGLPMGLVLAELDEKYGDDIPPLTADLLNEIYPFASRKSKTDDAFLEKARKMTAELQKGNPKLTTIWRNLVDLSVRDIKKTFDRLNVSFEYWYGESNSSKYLPDLLQILHEKNLLADSEGAKVVSVEQENDHVSIPPVIIVKSNGSEGYDTTDVAAILQRQRDFKPSQIWYVVDYRQSLHFTQVFRVARKANLIPEETQLIHLCFGTVNGKDGKPFKTRDGGVMQLSELLNSVTACAYEKLRTSDCVDPKSKKIIAEKIGIAAIKFGDLINHYSKDCIFDLDKFVASEGKTGVYLLYVIARINSLLKKAAAQGLQGDQINKIYSKSEQELLFKLALSGNAFLGAYNEKSPTIICENAYQIAVAFSKFYQENHILNEKDQQKKLSRIALCIITKDLLTKHLHALAIDPVDMM